MTDNRIEKIRAEIERLMNYFDSEFDDDPADVKAAKGNVCHEILSFINSLQEEPSISDIVDECWWKMLDPNIQYASREAGIKAHAEDYSFNIESVLFQQLSKEQQKLWRKEIEQACISGGYCGLNLGLDKRYDKEEPVSEDLGEAALLHLSKNYDTNVIWDEDEKCVVRDFKAGAKWQKTKDESTTKDLGEYISELSKQFPEVSFAKLSKIAVRVAKWQKEQIEKVLLSEVLPCFMHGGEAEEVMAKLDEVLN